MSNKLPKNPPLHGKIVREILPEFAEKLKKEAVISGYDRNPFNVSLVDNEPPIKINPDLVVHLPNGKKVLIEIANPRDPKRFLGEMVYPFILKYHKKIDNAIIFVLHDLEKQEIHDRGFLQSMILSQVLRGLMVRRMASWPGDDKNAYHNMKHFLKCILEDRVI